MLSFANLIHYIFEGTENDRFSYIFIWWGDVDFSQPRLL
jgi:hypothetical protein